MYWFNYFHDTVCTRVFDWQILDTKQLKVFTHMQDFKVKKKKERNRHPSISNVYFQISCYKIYSSKLRQRFSFGYTMLRTHHSLAKKKKNPSLYYEGWVSSWYGAKKANYCVARSHAASKYTIWRAHCCVTSFNEANTCWKSWNPWAFYSIIYLNVIWFSRK